MKRMYYFIERAENHFNNGLCFSEHNFKSIINELEQENEEYAPITWEELKDGLIREGHYYCYLQDTVVRDREEAKELGWIDEDDLDDDEYDEYVESLESMDEDYAEYVESELNNDDDA